MFWPNKTGLWYRDISLGGSRAAQCVVCGAFCQLIAMPTDHWGVSYCWSCWPKQRLRSVDDRVMKP